MNRCFQNRCVPLWLAPLLAALPAAPASAQLAPGIGYMFPPGGQAGTTVEVRLGGYDWTPDVEVFVHDERIKLELLGPPGPIIVPEPPYWFGKKGRSRAFPIPREAPARLTIPADVPPGLVRWQVANANGASESGWFAVGSGPEIVEQRHKDEVQVLPSLPITVSGQVLKIEQVDRYEFTARRSGPITCTLVARRIGSPLSAVLELRDAGGRLLADVADTEGRDASLTFVAEAAAQYSLSVYDLDFRGNRSYVYRLSVAPGPAVLAAIPAAGRRGKKHDVELIGIGVATGSDRLESVTRSIRFPREADRASFPYVLKTEHGAAAPFTLWISDLPERVEPPAGASPDERQLTLPCAITGVLNSGEADDRYTLAGEKGDAWDLSVEAEKIGSRLDVALAVLDAEGKELARGDDLPGTTDAGLQFVVPEDGVYTLQVTDVSGSGGDRAAVYRLVARPAAAGFTLSAPEIASVPIDGSVQIAVQARRSGGFTGEIPVSVSGLPRGVTVVEPAVIPEKKNDLKLQLQAAADCAAVATVVRVVGKAEIDEQPVEQQSEPLLLATVMKPRALVTPEGLDDVRKVPRGATYPAPVLIERLEGYKGPITLEMTAHQQRHRQGIWGPEVVVPPKADRAIYPVFLPEWCETTRTSRMILNTVVQVPDPKGNVRYLVNKMSKRIGMLPEGALLSLSHEADEPAVEVGEPFEIPLFLARAPHFSQPAHIELLLEDDLQGLLAAEPLTLDGGDSGAILQILPQAGGPPPGEHPLTIRATALHHGDLPVISETTVVVEFRDRGVGTEE